MSGMYQLIFTTRDYFVRNNAGQSWRR